MCMRIVAVRIVAMWIVRVMRMRIVTVKPKQEPARRRLPLARLNRTEFAALRGIVLRRCYFFSHHLTLMKTPSNRGAACRQCNLEVTLRAAVRVDHERIAAGSEGCDQPRVGATPIAAIACRVQRHDSLIQRATEGGEDGQRGVKAGGATVKGENGASYSALHAEAVESIASHISKDVGRTYRAA